MITVWTFVFIKTRLWPMRSRFAFCFKLTYKLIFRK